MPLTKGKRGNGHVLAGLIVVGAGLSPLIAPSAGPWVASLILGATGLFLVTSMSERFHHTGSGHPPDRRAGQDMSRCCSARGCRGNIACGVGRYVQQSIALVYGEDEVP